MHAITSLTLENFRNYASLQLSVPPKPVVLMGENGAGKTNILEAISLLSPGRGFRSAAIREMDRQGQPMGWVVAAGLRSGVAQHHIGTGRDMEAVSDRRIIKIDGEKQARQHALTTITAVQWLTPQMDTIFLQGNTARRGWLDRLTFGLDDGHAARVSDYESTMRERNKLLKDYEMPDPAWLDILERRMAELAVAISIARKDFLEKMTQVCAQLPGSFPTPMMRLEGELEDWITETGTAADAEEQLATALAHTRRRDQAVGRTLTGAHRSCWQVVHSTKNMPAEQCSTGEQKALLLSISLAAALARKTWRGTPPILLLDEVIAHLDVEKRDQLFDAISGAAIQSWLTGTNASNFEHLRQHATMLRVTAGEVSEE
jgi:DNA replication and repair protein RecF